MTQETQTAPPFGPNYDYWTYLCPGANLGLCDTVLAYRRKRGRAFYQHGPSLKVCDECAAKGYHYVSGHGGPSYLYKPNGHECKFDVTLTKLMIDEV